MPFHPLSDVCGVLILQQGCYLRSKMGYAIPKLVAKDGTKSIKNRLHIYR